MLVLLGLELRVLEPGLALRNGAFGLAPRVRVGLEPRVRVGLPREGGRLLLLFAVAK
jgi:hypothetical protein